LWLFSKGGRISVQPLDATAVDLQVIFFWSGNQAEKLKKKGGEL